MQMIVNIFLMRQAPLFCLEFVNAIDQENDKIPNQEGKSYSLRLAHSLCDNGFCHFLLVEACPPSSLVKMPAAKVSSLQHV